MRTHVLDFSLGGCGGMALYFNRGLTSSCFSYCMTNTGRNYRFKSPHCRPQRGISRTDRSDLHMRALVCQKVGQAIKLWKVSNQIILYSLENTVRDYAAAYLSMYGIPCTSACRDPWASTGIQDNITMPLCVCACVKHVKNGKHVKYCSILSIYQNLSG